MELKRLVFVIVLFIMAGACLVLGVIDRSLGWFIGGLVLLVLAFFARKLRIDEGSDTERSEPSKRFAVIGMTVSTVLTILMLWLASRG